MPSSTNGMPQVDPFPPEEFDAWAETYDQDVQDDGFPFTGYTQVLDTVVAFAARRAAVPYWIWALAPATWRHALPNWVANCG
jgi:hypothetical protein